MNVEIGTEAALFPEKEYISGIFLAVWLGNKVDSRIGLSYRPARLHRLTRPVRQPYAGVNFFPHSGTKNLPIELSTPTTANANECFPNYTKWNNQKEKGEYEEEEEGVGADFTMS